MNADRRETAQIYQFPSRPLAAARRAVPETSFAIDRVPHTPTADFGSGWYHDAAIQSEQVPPRAG